jgi:hypothetical protein
LPLLCLGGAGVIDHDAPLVDPSPHLLREVGLFGSVVALDQARAERIDLLALAGGNHPFQAVAHALELDRGTVAKLRDLVLELALEMPPHRLDAEFDERRFGLPDGVLGRREGRVVLAPIMVAPAKAQLLVSSARIPLEIELLRLGCTAPQNQRGKSRPAEVHVSGP